MMHRILALSLISLSTICLAQKHQDVKSDLDTRNIKEGVTKYLEYRENAEGQLLSVSTWEEKRRIYTSGGAEVLETKKSITSKKGAVLVRSLSLTRLDDLTPIYHYKRSMRGGVEAYDFHDKYIKGSDSVASNKKVDFRMDLETPTFNWVLDNAMFSSLKYENEKAFNISFYVPGARGGPQDYLYKVIGEEVISLGEAKDIDCWKLEIDYGDGNNCVWWVDKQEQQVLKMVELWNGAKRYKMRI
jgi:hypothetical protein